MSERNQRLDDLLADKRPEIEAHWTSMREGEGSAHT